MEDQTWLDLLRRRPATDGGQAADRGMDLVRAAIQDVNRAEAGDEPSDAELQRLLFRLRRERLLGMSRSRLGIGALSAAAVVVLAVALLSPREGQSPPDDDAATVLRGGAVQRTVVQEPEAVARAVADILRAQGASVASDPLADGVHLRATVPPANVRAANAALRAFSIEVPANGRLRVDIVHP